MFLEVVPCDVLFERKKSQFRLREMEREGETHLDNGGVPLVNVQRVECRVALGVTANIPVIAKVEETSARGEATGKRERRAHQWQTVMSSEAERM